MVLGDLYEQLMTLEKDMPIMWSDGMYILEEWGSDRGDYYNLYIGYSGNTLGDGYDKSIIHTVGELLYMVENIYESQDMEGYKGGCFPIEDYTTITQSLYGFSGCETGYKIIVKNNVAFIPVLRKAVDWGVGDEE